LPISLLIRLVRCRVKLNDEAMPDEVSESRREAALNIVKAGIE